MSTASSSAGIASFVEPTATISGVHGVAIAGRTYVGPFDSLIAGRHHQILIGENSNLQTNVRVDARQGDVRIGDDVLIAPGATIVGPSTLGGPAELPVFVGSNAFINGATLEPNTYVSPGATVGPGIIIHTGRKVLPGVTITTQQEADTPALGKVSAITTADQTAVFNFLQNNNNLIGNRASMFLGINPSLLGFRPL